MTTSDDTTPGAANEAVRHMVNRFLGWRLPDSFWPDGDVHFSAPLIGHWPHGTNLLNAAQAEEMVRYMLEGLPADATPPITPARLADSAVRAAAWKCIDAFNDEADEEGESIGKALAVLHAALADTAQGGRTDAERLDWLEQSERELARTWKPAGIRSAEEYGWCVAGYAPSPTIRAAIDAAMSRDAALSAKGEG